jgi:hypothetical protein
LYSCRVLLLFRASARQLLRAAASSATFPQGVIRA